MEWFVFAILAAHPPAMVTPVGFNSQQTCQQVAQVYAKEIPLEGLVFVCRMGKVG